MKAAGPAGLIQRLGDQAFAGISRTKQMSAVRNRPRPPVRRPPADHGWGPLTSSSGINGGGHSRPGRLLSSLSMWLMAARCVSWHHPAARSSVGCPAAARRLPATTAEPPQPGRLHNPANRGVQSADHFHLIGCHGGLSVGLSAYPTGQTHPKLVMSVHRRRTTPNCQTDTYQTLLRIKSGRVCFRVHTGGPENTERERIGTQ
jgi:hypothetical protein